MLKDGERRCDVCNRKIEKGEAYVVRRIPRSEIPSEFTITDMTPDESGHFRFDICRDCQRKIGLSGEPAAE